MYCIRFSYKKHKRNKTETDLSALDADRHGFDRLIKQKYLLAGRAGCFRKANVIVRDLDNAARIYSA